MLGRRLRGRGLAVAVAALIGTGLPCGAQGAAASGRKGALDAGFLGLYDATRFRAVDGRCTDCPTPKQALWYFRDDLVAVPKHAAAPGPLDSRLPVAADIRQWVAAGGLDRTTLPFMIWLGSADLIESARLQADGKAIQLAAGTLPLDLVPKLPSNRSYYDASTVEFFSTRPLRMRGRSEPDTRGGQRFVARAIWPEDYRISGGEIALEPLHAGESLASLIQADAGGSKSPFGTRLIWERSPGASRDWEHKAVLAFMLNGAQGDDDEAHGGHFAVVTGWHRGGEWADWMVNNFYNLNSVSEKGIVASMLPMDHYLMDLNSGQSYYRPSYLLVAILQQDTAAALYQSAVERVYDRFYRHHIEFDHARANCAGLSVDTLAGLGWHLPKRGPTSYAKAVLGYYYSSLTDWSFASGTKTFNYLTEERTRLYPRVAFEALGNDLLKLVATPGRTLTPYEQLLRDQVEAIVFVRIPQIPSSRAFGTYPVASFDEYMARVPADRKDWKIVAVDARPFPDELRDREPDDPPLSDNALGALATGSLIFCVVAPLAWWRARRRKRKQREVGAGS